MKSLKEIFLPSNPKKRKRRIILWSVIILLIGIRIWLPYFLKNRLVAAVNAVEGYECKLDDLDLELFRGAMIFQGFEIKVTTNNVQKPFVYIKNADISVEWREIFHGSIVSEIYLDGVNLFFADGNSKEEKQAGGASWVQPVIDFIPLKINTFSIAGGTIEFENAVSKPPVNLKLTDLNLIAKNLTNSTKLKDSLPSSVLLNSKILGKGLLHLDGKLNILKEIPDLDLNLSIKEVDLTELNDFTNAYAKFDFERGNFDLACEFAMIDKEVKGYVKPILSNVKVFSFDENGTVLNKFWEAFVGLAFNVTKNQAEGTSGTRVPISGRYDDPDVHVFTTILNILRNAFVKAYQAEVDGSIGPEDVGKAQDDSGFWKKIKKAFTKDDKGKDEKKEDKKDNDKNKKDKGEKAEE